MTKEAQGKDVCNEMGYMSNSNTTSAPRSLWHVVVLILLGCYFFLMTAQLVWLTPGGRTDDSEAMFLSQSFAWGYEGKNPPLFYWLTTLFNHLVGPLPAVVFGLRMFFLFLMLWGALRLARLVQVHDRLAILAGLMPLTFLHLHWYALHDLTHTVISGAMFPWTLIALFGLEKRPTVGRYLMLGLFITAGLLSKYTYVLFVIASAISCWLIPRYRLTLYTRKSWPVLFFPLLLGTPHLLWMAEHLGGIQEQMQISAGVSLDGGYWVGVAHGLGSLVVASFEVLFLPFGILVVTFLGKSILQRHSVECEKHDRLMLIRYIITAFFVLLLFYILLGASRIKPHHLFIMVLVPIWLIGGMHDSATNNLQLRISRFSWFVAGVPIVTLALFGAHAWREAQTVTCGRCSEYLPYRDYADAIHKLGFNGGTLVSLSPRKYMPGSLLRPYLSETRFVAPQYSLYQPPKGKPGDCIILYSSLDDAEIGQMLREGRPVPGIGLPLPSYARWERASGNFYMTTRAAPDAVLVLIPGGLGTCR